ncbi:MAG: SDR family oxidoreductase [Calothrix sp. FI2-JRJ7]|nr:SDR family oxidoreductase [Calothrix sp. FI2-JRJ7]
MPKMIDVVNLSNSTESHLESTLSDIQKKFGAIAGFIHIHPAAKNASSLFDLFPENEKEIVKLVFLIAKHLKSSLNTAAKNSSDSNAYFLTVSQLDGQLGTGAKKASSIIGGGLPGLVKSLHREWAPVCSRHIDLEPGMAVDEAANVILEEMADTNSGLLEVGRTKLERMTLTLEQVQHNAYQHNAYTKVKKPNRESVFLVSGGGRGITADCVVELAYSYKSKFILLGRTALQVDKPDWADKCTDEKELKKLIIDDIVQKGKKPTPVEVNKILHDLISQREIQNTLERVNSCGGEAIYISTDVTNKTDLQEQIARVQKNIGVITGIIHGAGNIADKRIEKKSQEDYHRVIEPKVKGLENILSVINPLELKYLFLFSSVAGYFGNPGQTDYALANEILNKFAYSFKHLFPQTHVVSINWGPWERGMIDPTLNSYYKLHNIELIPVDLGVKFCRDEFCIPLEYAAEQILVSARLSIPNQQIENPKAAEIQRILSADNNPFLKDHVILNNAVLPATCAINWMVKSCEDILPNYKVRLIEKFKVLKGIVFDENYNNEYFTSLTFLGVQEDLYTFEVRVSSQHKLNNNRIYHYGATISFEKEWGIMPIYTNLDIKSDGKLYTPYGSESVLFHGETFQGVKKVLQLGNDKITSLCNLGVVEQKEQGQFSVNSFNAYLADVQLQNVLLWANQQLGGVCLPLGCKKIEQFQPLNFQQDFYVSAEIISSNNSCVTANVFVHNERGEIYIQWTHIDYIIVKKLQKRSVTNHG